METCSPASWTGAAQGAQGDLKADFKMGRNQAGHAPAWQKMVSTIVLHFLGLARERVQGGQGRVGGWAIHVVIK